MKRKFTGDGDWPTPRGGPRVTNADIKTLQEETPSVFAATVAATDMFVNHLLPMTQRLFPFEITPDMTGDDIRLAAFRAMQSFGRDLHEALIVPAPEVVDE